MTLSTPEPWSEIDAWRSIWEALAIVNDDDPETAVNGHRRLCLTMGWESMIMSGIIVETLDGEIRVKIGQQSDTVEVVIRDDDKEGNACAEMTLEQAYAFLDAFRQYLGLAEAARKDADVVYVLHEYQDCDGDGPVRATLHKSMLPQMLAEVATPDVLFPDEVVPWRAEAAVELHRLLGGELKAGDWHVLNQGDEDDDGADYRRHSPTLEVVELLR